MAVSLRATGTWAELTADGTVAIPSPPQAGDRMYLFARWKDFSVTATVANWTELAEFADGAVTAGNGTGSVKVGCWYRDWQPGDSDPTIDFSASPDNASVVITVMQKDVDDVWNTPIARTAAMTNWTTTSQIVSASATVAVPSGGVVMGLIGIRDDTAAMTRPTTGLDDSAAAVTWNGNYVESPATHHSTTTGFDGAADLGYRLVATGATATLRMTGTISAAETGAALWVIQGTTIVVTPGVASLNLTTFAPTLGSSVTPATAALEVATLTPLLAVSVVPNPTGLVITTFAPSLTVSAIPSPAALTITTSAPVLAASVTPVPSSLLLTTFSPSLRNSVVPSTRSLIVTTFTPVLSVAIIPGLASLVLTTFRPSIWPPGIVYLDPGGDAVQAVGYFNTLLAGSTGVSFDTAQKVVGVGSYKFDSLTGVEGQQGVSVTGVMSSDPGVLSPRRFSCYFRYDSVPDKVETTTRFVGSLAVYSGGGFADIGINLAADDGGYSTTTPAKNTGQGMVLGAFGIEALVPASAAIDSVKVIYERKYDVNTSIGISRIKYRIDGIEGPDYDNTDMPLTDTVVTVEFTDRGFTREDLLDGVFEIIAEARRGDTDTEHTQSWDYVKVEVEWHLDGIIQVLDSINEASFKIGLAPKGSAAVLRFVDNDGRTFYGITELLINTWNRISFAYIQNGANDLSINIFVNGIPELSLVEVNASATAMYNLRYGWLDNPGTTHFCWFDQLIIDDGDDLSDIGNALVTAKLPASVNENNWNTTVGTGAVNERPLDLANRMVHTANSLLRQTYTLQTAATGDIDISAATLIGYMGWSWARLSSGSFDNVGLVLNNVEIDRSGFANQQSAGSAPVLFNAAVSSSSYPSHAAGIGMLSNEFLADTLMYECGAVIAYRPVIVNPNLLMAYQVLAEGSTTNITDDLRADPQDSYELCYRIDDGDASVLITIYSIPGEGHPPQLQGICGGQGGYGRTRITPGIEVQVVLEVTGGNVGVSVWRRVNIA